MKTNTVIQDLLERISELTGISTEKKEGENFHIYVEYNSAYGGYRLIKIYNQSGGQGGIFGGNGCEPRLSKKEFEIKLRGIIEGLCYNKNN